MFQEDEKVLQLVREYGPKRWTLISKHLKGRTGKQCRERWHNHLNPDIKKCAWTEDEDRLIYQVGVHCQCPVFSAEHQGFNALPIEVSTVQNEILYAMSPSGVLKMIYTKAI